MNENIFKNLVRIGTVSSIDTDKRTARVIFKDKDEMVSGWLHVLQWHGAGIYVKPEGEHRHDISGGSKTGANGEHDHSANLTYWMPRINDTVVALYLPVFNADGFILGAI